MERSEKRIVWAIAAACVALLAGFWLCGAAHAAEPSYNPPDSAIEVRAGYHASVFAGLGISVPKGQAAFGGLLEYDEDDTYGVFGRAVREWPQGRAVLYAGVDVGYEWGEVPYVAPEPVSDCDRYTRREDAAVPTVEDVDGFAGGFVAGVRSPRGETVGWLIEATVREGQVEDGVGGAFGLTLRY